MTRSRSGGDRNGIGFYEMMKLRFEHPLCYRLVLCMLKMNMGGIARRYFLDIR